MKALCLQGEIERREDRRTRNAASAVQPDHPDRLSSAVIRLRHLNNVRHFLHFVRKRPDSGAIEASFPALMAASARLVMLSTPVAPPLTFRPFGAARRSSRRHVAIKAASGRNERRRTRMRVMTQTELSRLTRGELLALLHRIAQMLPDFADGSAGLDAAHSNLQNIRRALSQMPKPTSPKPRLGRSFGGGMT